MSGQTQSTIDLQRAMEAIRQESVTFDQRRSQDERWFVLKCTMGWISIIIILVIMIGSGYIFFNASSFPLAIVDAAIVAVFVDILGLGIAVWKIVLNQAPITKLEPVTKDK
jgi:hypothetical protein